MKRKNIVGELINFRGLVYAPTNEQGVGNRILARQAKEKHKRAQGKTCGEGGLEEE